jgi:hypothetical protein
MKLDERNVWYNNERSQGRGLFPRHIDVLFHTFTVEWDGMGWDNLFEMRPQKSKFMGIGSTEHQSNTASTL